MKFYRNAIILVVVFGILLTTYFVLQNRSEKENNEDKSILVKSINKDSITQVDIRNDKGFIELIKEDANWKMQKPADYLLDSLLVDSFISTVSNLNANTLIEEEINDLSIYGLDEPSSTVTITTDNGTKVTYLLGAQLSINDEYYLKLSDSDKIYGVSSFVAGDLLRSTSEFRDKSIFEFKSEDVTEFSVYNNGKTYVLNLEEEKIKNTITKISTLKTSQYLDVPKEGWKQHGIEPALSKYTFTFKDGSKKELYIGEDYDGYTHYGKKSDSDQIFVIANFDVNLLEEDLEGLVMKD